MGINYQELIDNAMHIVIKSALQHIATHHDKFVSHDSFMISFVTNYPGVVISERLKKLYPDEMLIVIQYQFDDLIAYDHKFNITLYFDDKPETITIPYKAINSYIDRQANFALNFHVDKFITPPGDEKLTISNNPDDASNVIFLDKFRK